MMWTSFFLVGENVTILTCIRHSGLAHMTLPFDSLLFCPEYLFLTHISRLLSWNSCCQAWLILTYQYLPWYSLRTLSLCLYPTILYIRHICLSSNIPLRTSLFLNLEPCPWFLRYIRSPLLSLWINLRLIISTLKRLTISRTTLEPLNTLNFPWSYFFLK